MSVVLVTGGTGTLGTVVVPALVAAGHDVRVMSRHDGTDVAGAPRVVADLASGAGLPDAVRGVGTVLHLASNPLRPKQTDVEGTRRLVVAAAAAGVGHVGYLSIVGCDRVPYPYYRAKAAAEQLVLSGAVPGTVLRATQFHEFVPLLARMVGFGRFVLLPKGLRSQLVDLRDVADRLVALVDAGPSGRVRDLAGPQVVDARDAVLRWSDAVGRPRPRVVRPPVVGGTLRGFAAGGNLPDAGADLGTRTFDAWLDEQRAQHGRTSA